ncbi:MAG: transcriptional regulator, LacI family [Firmicutes bacterium]|nr:transcriptional regulator, LacI family [Bacillota bacterium]
MVTIADVAAMAGVSVATVSRVLNNSYIVSPEKRARVTEAIEALNYKPNVYGRNLRRTESKLILVVCSTVIEEIMNGIQDTAKDLGYDIVLNYTGSRKKSLDSIKFLQNGLVDGVIYSNLFFADEELINISRQFPVVQCGELLDIPNSFLVSNRDEEAAYNIVHHLISQGKKRIGLVTLSDAEASCHFSKEREKGYIRALTDFNIPYDPELIRRGDMSFEYGLEAANYFLQMKNRPDAIFCVQDIPAVGCINAIKSAGVAIPDDIAVAGFDNVELAEMCDPPLTTVAQPFYEIGRETMRTLVSLIKGEITIGRHILLDSELIIRGSTVKK